MKVKEIYWKQANHLSRIKALFYPQNKVFRKVVVDSYVRHYLTGLAPPKDSVIDDHADAAASWLLRAQKATGDDGVSHGFFPCHWEMGWRPSYPETTGYIIPSLLDYADWRQLPEIRDRAIAMAFWEAGIQMGSGAVQGGTIVSYRKQKAAVFNTGMVLQGWVAAYRATGDEQLFEAGKRAADFLVADQGSNGHYQSHGGFVTQDLIKTYNVLCSWALYQFGVESSNSNYKDAALRNGEATLLMQHENGWFDKCCLTNPEAPLTHTLGYTLQGLCELGHLSGREDFISAVERGVEPLMQNIMANGYLSGRFDRNWRSTAGYSCLTGSAQIAIVLYRLAQIKGDASYVEAATRLINYLKAVQEIRSLDSNLNGAIPGSYPILGGYMTAGYPNWATKYFLDALLLQEGKHELLQGI